MALPLKDFRLGITETIDIALDAQAIAFGKDKAAVARDVLEEWAKRKMHEHKVMARRFAANGVQPELFGDEPEDDGGRREDAGASRQAARR
jgi:hypothetical protein